MESPIERNGRANDEAFYIKVKIKNQDQVQS